MGCTVHANLSSSENSHALCFAQMSIACLGYIQIYAIPTCIMLKFEDCFCYLSKEWKYLFTGFSYYCRKYH